ncbi:dihydrodipicolinate reductase C-terminal domain-containing protein [Streptomyces sp. NPDC002537]
MPEPDGRTAPRSGPAVGVAGTGRLGTAVLRHCAREGLATRTFDTRSPQDWAHLPVPDVIVDCGAGAATHRVLALCADLRVPLIECVSDLTEDHLARMAHLARDVPVVRATNLSLGNYLQTRVLERLTDLLTGLERAGLATALPEAAVLERHTAAKAHRPSATATALARRWEERTGTPVGDIASLRAGLPVSDHEIRLGWQAQTLVVRHEVHSLEAAATGAVAAARWAATRAPGLYGLHSVFDDLAAGAAGTPPTTGADDRGHPL